MLEYHIHVRGQEKSITMHLPDTELFNAYITWLGKSPAGGSSGFGSIKENVGGAVNFAEIVTMSVKPHKPINR